MEQLLLPVQIALPNRMILEKQNLLPKEKVCYTMENR